MRAGTASSNACAISLVNNSAWTSLTSGGRSGRLIEKGEPVKGEGLRDCLLKHNFVIRLAVIVAM